MKGFFYVNILRNRMLLRCCFMVDLNKWFINSMEIEGLWRLYDSDVNLRWGGVLLVLFCLCEFLWNWIKKDICK